MMTFLDGLVLGSVKCGRKVICCVGFSFFNGSEDTKSIVGDMALQGIFAASRFLVRMADRSFVNMLRGGKENLTWSPVFEDTFHTLKRCIWRIGTYNNIAKF